LKLGHLVSEARCLIPLRAHDHEPEANEQAHEREAPEDDLLIALHGALPLFETTALAEAPPLEPPPPEPVVCGEA